MKSIATILILVGLSYLVCSTGFADTFVISANVPQATNVNVTLSKIDSKGTPNPDDDTWLGQATSINFGDLEPRMIDDTNIILLPKDNSYYAADVGIDGAGPWTIHHKVSGADFLNEGDDALGDNIIVTFVKQITSTTAETLDKLIIMDSNGKTVDSSTLSGGWLRIYYGIASGADGEPGDASPITPTQTAREYSGTVEITLTTP